jgi:hypothetical protein
MMMTTQTKTGAYLKRMANGGHFKQKLGETALALTECFCKADNPNRARLGNSLATQMHHILVEVYGWNTESAREATETLRKAFRDTDEGQR